MPETRRLKWTTEGVGETEALQPSFASHAVVERKDRSARIFPGGPLKDAAGGYKSPVLADALGAFGTSSQECLLGAVILFAAPFFRGRVRENA
jgi:hypothetical protein